MLSRGYDNLFSNWIDKKRYLYIKQAIFQNHIPIAKTK